MKRDSRSLQTSESILVDTAVSAINTTIEEAKEKDSDPSYSKIDDSFFQHAKPLEAEPVNQKTGAEHQNTIYENLFGSNITVTKLLDKQTGKEKIISKHKQKMGPVLINITHGRLTDDWEEANRNEVADYKANSGSSEVCIHETWVKDPPNILVLHPNRVSFNKEAGKLEKSF